MLVRSQRRVTGRGGTGSAAHASLVEQQTSAAPRISLRILQLGAVAAVVAASLQKSFELDRFLVPKELALHLTAFLAGVFAFRALRRTRYGSIDLLLGVFLILGVVSAAVATNPWVAFRALALSASAIAIFWIARAIAEGGDGSRILNAIALAVVLAAVTSLLQTYGVRLDLFSINRAPGGTLGNRNFVAHAAAFGFPIVFLVALRSRLALLGVPIVVAALVLTRSRAAWLAMAAALVVLAAMIPLRAHWRRIVISMILSAAAVAAALLVPNTLRWRSDNPYLDSVADVANYEEGSGRGRLIQYTRSLRMAAGDPILGVGPGNWAVEYPEHVPRRDPSLDRSEGGMTANPWPSSDWIAFVSERGFVAALLLAVALGGMALQSMRRTPESAALVAMLAAAVVAGLFDAVLMLALPALLVWASLGALWRPEAGRTMPAMAILAMLLVSAAGAARSTAQWIGMELYDTAPSQAAMIDPGSYRAHMRLARRSCDHARAAHALYPAADAARDAARRCR